MTPKPLPPPLMPLLTHLPPLTDPLPAPLRPPPMPIPAHLSLTADSSPVPPLSPPPPGILLLPPYLLALPLRVLCHLDHHDDSANSERQRQQLKPCHLCHPLTPIARPYCIITSTLSLVSPSHHQLHADVFFPLSPSTDPSTSACHVFFRLLPPYPSALHLRIPHHPDQLRRRQLTQLNQNDDNDTLTLPS
ncbi:hypothetical protein EDB83DRAFT_2522333 [Lactarius deliciosus]|nr:hypothetical protein EDB83DRAFT_2522333 [Lactarius deliciosus]